ncbi:MAG: Rrf2 family transcriptional regulator [candidate division Zixibacteria bacterium]|nr:Rrf2 family transcriptional regulator [candidate division Zixibacteria bacterium]
MSISTRGRYGLRALLEIAQNYGSGPINIRDISKNQKISMSYLEQILHRLRKAGLIRSIRGAKGGYILARDSDKITVKDIVKVLDGPIGVAYCDFPNLREKSCIGPKICASSMLWKKLELTIDDFLSSVTLADLKDAPSSLKRGMRK